MNRILIAVAVIICSIVGASAQAVEQGIAVTACGTPGRTYTAGQPGALTLDTNGNLCFTGTGGTITAAPYLYTPVTGAQYGLAVASSTALTVPATATQALICVEGAPVRWTDDGTTPTTTVGQPLVVGQCKAWSGALAALQAIRFIQQSATATIDVSYYK